MPKATDKDIDVFIGSRVKERRVIMNISQIELAQYLELSVQQVQKYESGVNRISASKLFVLSKLLNVDISYFYDGLSKNSIEVNVDQIQKKIEAKLDKLAARDLPNSNIELQSLTQAYSNIEDPVVRQAILKMISSMDKQAGGGSAK